MGEGFCSAAIHRRQCHLTGAPLKALRRIDNEHQVALVAVRTGMEKPLEPILSEPEEHLSVKELIPITGRKSVLQSTPQSAVVHGLLISHNRHAMDGMTNLDGLGPV